MGSQNMEQQPEKMNVEIKQLDSSQVKDFIDMLLLFEEVFKMEDFQMLDKHYLQELLKQKNFIVFAAMCQDDVIGGLTAHILPSYHFQSSEVYIYDLAVKTEFQRRGIGRKLIESIKEYCKVNNLESFFVQAHEEDTHALEFYHSAGGLSEKVVHYTYPMRK